MVILSSTANSTHTYLPAYKVVDWIAWALVVIGAINWGLVGVMGVDLVAAIFGTMTVASRLVYVLVGLAGLYFISMPFRRVG